MPKEIGAFENPEDPQWLLDTVRDLVRKEWALQAGHQPAHNDAPTNEWVVVNASGEVIPAYACMQITSPGTSRPPSDRTFLTASKPIDRTGTGGWYVFNGHEEIGVGATVKYGWCQVGPHARAFTTTGGAVGNRFGPVIGSWEIAPAMDGPFIYSGVDPLRPNTHRVFIYGGGDGGLGAANRMKGYLKTCLKKCDDTVEVTVYDPCDPTAGPGGQSGCGAGRNGPIAWNLFNGTGVFDGIDFQGGASVDLTMQNAWALDGITGSAVIFERVFGCEFINGTNPDAWEWQITEIEDRIARLVFVSYAGTYPSGTWNIVNYFEGTDPRECGTPDIRCELNCDCIQNGTKGIGYYVPELDRYAVVAELKLRDETVLDLGDGDTMTWICEDNEYCAQMPRKTIKVIDCGLTVSSPPETLFCISDELFECLDLCEWICLYCPDDWGYDPDFCDPCIGTCYWVFDDPSSSGDGQWIPDTGTPNTCTPTDPDCGCYDPPPYDPSDPPSHGATATTECSHPPPCTGECYWIYRVGTFNTQSGTYDYNYWEAAGNDCTDDIEDCGCCEPPTAEEVPNPLVNAIYGIPCASIPECSGHCIYYWDLSGQEWVELVSYCCGTSTTCDCGSPPTAPGQSDGDLSGEVLCTTACSGDCVYEWHGPTGGGGTCYGITFSKSGSNPQGALPGQEPPLFADGRYIYKSYSLDTDTTPNGQQCATATWLIHWCNTTESYVDLFLDWWNTNPLSPKNDGWGLQGPTAIGCDLADRQTWVNANEDCPPNSVTNTTLDHEDPLQSCVTVSPAAWRLLSDTCSASCECEDPPSDTTGFPSSPDVGDTHTVEDGCEPS